ncbi:MAG: hypothetical protein P0S94_00360 [Simkaniaceae bacterium]|nr:hypothetical protein [Simkaniaceae bacterium]
MALKITESLNITSYYSHMSIWLEGKLGEYITLFQLAVGYTDAATLAKEALSGRDITFWDKGMFTALYKTKDLLALHMDLPITPTLIKIDALIMGDEITASFLQDLISHEFSQTNPTNSKIALYLEHYTFTLSDKEIVDKLLSHISFGITGVMNPRDGAISLLLKNISTSETKKDLNSAQLKNILSLQNMTPDEKSTALTHFTLPENLKRAEIDTFPDDFKEEFSHRISDYSEDLARICDYKPEPWEKEVFTKHFVTTCFSSDRYNHIMFTRRVKQLHALDVVNKDALIQGMIEKFYLRDNDNPHMIIRQFEKDPLLVPHIDSIDTVLNAPE